MLVRRSTKLPISADDTIALVCTPALLNHVAAPLLRFVPLEPKTFPREWQDEPYLVRVLLAGVLPLGRQWIDISRVEAADGSFRLRDNGRGDLARRWDHWITITAEKDGACVYVDEVEIEAGLLTPLVGIFARLFYSHRQRRWRSLATDSGAGARELLRSSAWRERLDAELQTLATARADGDVAQQWHALERAHILSQVSLLPHIHVHWLMLGLAQRLGQGREVAGQALRLLLAPLGKLTGRIPWGNTGRATVNAFTPMPIPPDLRDVMPSLHRKVF
jgi:hypothetical protein